MDIRKIKKLIELLEESGIAEIEIKEGEEAVRISRMSPGALSTHPPQGTHLAGAPSAAATCVTTAGAAAVAGAGARCITCGS